MAQFGWAYIDCSSSGPGGTDQTIQFNSGSTHSGSANFIFNYSANRVLLTGSAILSGSSTNILTVVGNVSGSNNLLVGNDVTASAFSGGGSNLTNLNASSVSAGTLNNARLPATISVTNVTASSLVSASLFYGDGSNLTGISAGATPGGPNQSVQFNSGSSLSGSSKLTFNYTTNLLSVTGDISASVNISGSDFYGGGANLTSLNASNVSAGTLNNARLPANISVTNLAGAGASITALDADNINAGTLNNARLPATISVTNVTASSLVSASFFHGNGSNLTNLPATSPGGSNTQIQYNADGAFGADSDFTWNSGSNTLTVTGDVSASINVSASEFYGDGSNLTALNASSISAGTLNNARLPANISVTNLAGAGASITALDADNINAGTLNNARLPATISVTNVTASSLVSASFFYGDGSNLTNIGTSTSAALHSSSFTVASTSDILAINSSGSIITASLPAANTYASGYRLSFKDVQGFAATNNILVKPSGSENIDGSNSGILITTNYGAVEVFSNGVNSYHILSTN